jgi:hypothetical protein
MAMSLGPGTVAGLLVSLVGVAHTSSLAAQGDPCALLTQAEAAAILGQSIGAPVKGGSGECHYSDEGGSAEIVVYPMPLGFKSKEEFHAFVVEDTEAMNARIKKSMRNTGATVKETAVEPVAEVGAAAYYVDPSLIVLSHSRVLNITAGNRDQAVAVARKVVPRFK